MFCIVETLLMKNVGTYEIFNEYSNQKNVMKTEDYNF